MNKGIVRIVSVLIALVLMLSVTSVSVLAVGEGGGTLARSRAGESRAVNTYSLSGISSRSVYSYEQRAVYFNSASLGSIARIINGEVYLPVRRLVEQTGAASVSYNSGTKTMTVTGGGHNISVSDGAYALYANGRVMFEKTPSVILSDGRMYTPARTLTRALSLQFSVASDGSVRVSGTPTPVVSGSRYYAEDAVYWLARIISAESRGEPLIGQIAVGSVVLNRTRSSAFPSTIYGVIFDRKYGVQFSPVSNGTIYNTPTSSAILAAKICLEGFSVSDRALYFLRPSASTSSWIVKNREFLFVIGNHYFFA